MNKHKSKEFINTRGWRLWLPLKNCGCISLLFLLFIFLPLVDQLSNFSQPLTLVEKRRLAQKPSFNSRKPFEYIKRFEAFYNDHFSFRTPLVYLNNLLTFKIFHTSASEKVLIGKQGWLFLGNVNKLNNEIDYYRNFKPFTEEELRYWQILLEERRNWLQQRGIHYLFAIAPNKSTIFPEFMPGSIIKSRKPSRLDQLIDHLKKNSTVSILDLRPALWQANKIRATYYRTDTHWNEWGGYIAYREVIQNLKQYFSFISPRPLHDFNIRQVGFMKGDLVLMLSLPNVFFEKRWRFEAKNPSPCRLVSVENPNPGNKLIKISALACATGSLPTALMVHDSFIHQLRPFLSQEFSKIIYVWDWSLNFFKQIIEKEKVEIVIDEMTERSLLSCFPENPPELRD